MKYLLFLLLPFSLLSQNIKGKVYDNESTVKGIKVFNLTKQIRTYTGNNGEFTIPAQINDTIVFESLFHLKKAIKLKPIHFEDIIVFELRKKTSALGEVLLFSTKPITESELKGSTESLLAYDKRVNPHLYMPKSSYSYGANARELFKLFKKLLKSKKKQPEKHIGTITFETLDSLFQNDKLFNLELLRYDLNIPEEYAYLFLEYCETKALKKSLITEENKVILLDSLMNFSRSFTEITQNFKKTEDTLSLKN
ncbi:hypothetical protein [Hyunsoonleella rubra]|uniref:Carboxypeptidase-like regulatory domain-containing protein n=1 Tax=Hyunsoonleella rubra TaxID=1737062 RepID=A0ABW5T6B5_9FLAO